MLNNNRAVFRTAINALIFSICILASVVGCTEEPDRYYISVHQLRLEPEKYRNKEVALKGYLSHRLSKTGGPIFLFATKDDAEMRNNAAGVFIDVLANERLSTIENCLEHFVEVVGTFRETDDRYAGGGLGVTNVEWLKIITEPTPGLNKPNREKNYCVLSPGMKSE